MLVLKKGKSVKELQKWMSVFEEGKKMEEGKGV